MDELPGLLDDDGSVAIDEEALDALAKLVASPARPKPRRKRAPRKRCTEFDEAGMWVDVRRFDRMPVTTEVAEKMETGDAPKGMYFASLARKRIVGMVLLHSRWLRKTKNATSQYAALQRDLMKFFESTLDAFDSKYAEFVSHPSFDAVGVTRRRRSPREDEEVR